MVLVDATEIESKSLVARYEAKLLKFHDQLAVVADKAGFDLQDSISNYLFIKDNLPTLLNNQDFIEGAAEILGRDFFWQKLKNGKWFKIV